MDQRITAKEIIETIVDAMHSALEPLIYSVLAPSIYQVHLGSSDFERLAGIFPRIIEETKLKLDQELDELNRGGVVKRVRRRFLKVEGVSYESAEGDWYISFQENADEDLEAGSFDVSIELTLPAQSELSGASTKRITFRRSSLGETRKIRESIERPSQQSPSRSTIEPEASVPTSEEETQRIFASLSYEDDKGSQTFQMTKNQIVIGRGGMDYWIDLRLYTSDDVSREHARLRRDPATGKFYIKDLSTHGTTVDNKKIPSSIEFAGDVRRDINVELELPAKALIGLADIVFINFRAIESK
jgi:pSer/pThr/pTyr-binding forkhead associated (FHA) protein